MTTDYDAVAECFEELDELLACEMRAYGLPAEGGVLAWEAELQLADGPVSRAFNRVVKSIGTPVSLDEYLAYRATGKFSSAPA